MDSSTAKPYVNEGGTAYFSLSRLACHILNHADKHVMTLIPAYILTNLIVEANNLSWGTLVPEWNLLLYLAQATFQLYGQQEVALLSSSHTYQCQHYHTLENQLPLEALELNVFNHAWTNQMSQVFPPFALVPLVLSTFLAEHVTGQV